MPREKQEKRPCSIVGCSRSGCMKFAYGRGYCRAHYERAKKYGDPLASYQRISGPGTECSVAGCEKSVFAHGLCGKHNARFRKHGDTTTIGGKRGRWPEKIIGSSGYNL